MNYLKSLVTAAAIIAPLGAMHGASYYDAHLAGPAFHYLTQDTPYSHTFNLVGFNPATEVVDWAKLYIAFADDPQFFWSIPYVTDNPSWGDGEEWVTVGLDGNAAANWEPDGSHYYGFDWRNISGNALVTALGNGSVDVTINVTNRNGDTYIKEVMLKAKTVTRQVPDGGSTVALLGAGLLGLLALKRRRS